MHLNEASCLVSFSYQQLMGGEPHGIILRVEKSDLPYDLPFGAYVVLTYSTENHAIMGQTRKWRHVYEWVSNHQTVQFWIRVTGEKRIQGGHLPIEQTMKSFRPDGLDNNQVIITASSIQIMQLA